MKLNKFNIIFYNDKKQLDIFYSKIKGYISVHIISDIYPIISNLNVIENICLGQMYKNNISINQAMTKLKNYINDLNMQKKLKKRKQDLNYEEIIKVYILRALSEDKNYILIENPDKDQITTIINILEKINNKLNLIIVCNQYLLTTYKYIKAKIINIQDII